MIWGHRRVGQDTFSTRVDFEGDESSARLQQKPFSRPLADVLVIDAQELLRGEQSFGSIW